jgi:hypothetical protein
MDRRKVGRSPSWRSPSRPVRPEAGRPVTPASDYKTGSFDQWLDHRLKEMYGAVVDEPLPTDLKDLVEKLSRDEEESSDRNK